MSQQDSPSPTALGAVYALLNGDLETATALAQQNLEADPYSKENYLILSYSCSGLGRWYEAAKYSRLAYCFGVRDNRVSALLAGLYQACQLTRESEWLVEQNHIEALNLTQVLPQEDIQTLYSELSQPPKQPQKKRIQNSQAREAHSLKPIKQFKVPVATSLPDWIESSQEVSLDLIQTVVPSWLSSNEDSLDLVFSIPHKKVNWLDDQEIEQQEVLRAKPKHASSSSLPEPSLASQKSASQKSASQKSTSQESHPLAAQELAKAMGLGQVFLLAIHVNGLKLTQISQTGQQEKNLPGTILLALTSERLMIVSHTNGSARQRPWAFEKSQLLSTESRQTQIKLFVEGQRELSFLLESEEQANSVSSILKQW